MNVKEEGDMGISRKRLSILTKGEIEKLFGLPKFTYEDRLIYFSLNQAEKQMVDIHRSHQSKLYFILQLGYFKAKNMFFVFDFSMVKKDVQHILIQYFPEIDEIPEENIPKRTSIDMQKKILGLFGYRLCNQPTKTILQTKAILSSRHKKSGNHLVVATAFMSDKIFFETSRAIRKAIQSCFSCGLGPRPVVALPAVHSSLSRYSIKFFLLTKGIN